MGYELNKLHAFYAEHNALVSSDLLERDVRAYERVFDYIEKLDYCGYITLRGPDYLLQAIAYREDFALISYEDGRLSVYRTVEGQIEDMDIVEYLLYKLDL